jgi:hypothetical protein
MALFNKDRTNPKSDRNKDRVPKRFQEKRPDRTRPSTPEPELQTDPRRPDAPQLGATPQLVAEEYTLPDGYVHTPGSYQSQRTWRDSETQPDAFDTALQECHADCLRANRNADGIPAEMEFVGYSWQLSRDGNGVLYNTIYACYAPGGAAEAPPDPPAGREATGENASRGEAGTRQAQGLEYEREQEEKRQREQREREAQGQHTFQPGAPPQPAGPFQQTPHQPPHQPNQPGNQTSPTPR